MYRAEEWKETFDYHKLLIRARVPAMQAALQGENIELTEHCKRWWQETDLSKLASNVPSLSELVGVWRLDSSSSWFCESAEQITINKYGSCMLNCRSGKIATGCIEHAYNKEVDMEHGKEFMHWCADFKDNGKVWLTNFLPDGTIRAVYERKAVLGHRETQASASKIFPV